MSELNQAIEGWNKLADDAEQWASYEESRGHYGGVYLNQADSYRRTAKALTIQRDTGIAVCSCCFKPYGRGNSILIN